VLFRSLALTFEYGMTSPNQTHAGDWAAGNTDGSDTFETEAAIWIPGTANDFALSIDGLYGSFANTSGESGSPGIIPTPGTVALLGLGGIAAIRRRR